MKVEYFLIARDSSIDEDRRSISIFDVVEEIRLVPQAPGVIPIPLHAVISLIREESDPKGLLTLPLEIVQVVPSGATAAAPSVTIAAELQPEHRRCRIRGNIPTLIDGRGVYTFKLIDSSHAKTMATVEILVEREVPQMEKEKP